jgi:hypothetical protein
MSGFTVVEAEGNEVESFDNQVDACEFAEAHSEEHDVDCHVSDSFGRVVACFGR